MMVELMLISNYSNRILNNSKREIMKNLGKKPFHFERIVGFVSFLETYVCSVNSVSDKQNTSVRIHSSVLKEYFGGSIPALKAKKILFKLGILDISSGFFIQGSKGICSSYTPLFQKKNGGFSKIESSEFSRFNQILSVYSEEHEEELSEEYKVLKESYKSLYFRKDKADIILKSLYGKTYDEIKHLSEDKISLSDVPAVVSVNNLDLIQSKKMHFKIAHGRVFTPFHSLPKALRGCLEIEHEELVEAFDVKACFPLICVGIVSGILEKQNDRNYELVKSLFNDMIHGSDIYSMCGGDRKKDKMGLLYYLFSNFGTKTWLRKLYTDLSSMSIEHKDLLDKVSSQVFEERRRASNNIGIMELDNECINTLASLSNKSIEHMNSFDKKSYCVRTCNAYNKATSLVPVFDNIEHVSDIRVRTFAFEVSKISNSISKTSNNACSRIHEYFKMKSKNKGFNAPSIKDIKRAYGRNLSTEAQEIESKVFINRLLPALRMMFPKSTFITLHDAIYCKKSVALQLSSINIQTMFSVALNKELGMWAENNL